MNLEDVIDPEYGLQQDEWSLSKPKFGEKGQLTVIGWSGKVSTNKVYITKCDICSLDSELFGSGCFAMRKGCLIRGRLPCGCSCAYRKTKVQFEIISKRAAQDMGISSSLSLEIGWVLKQR